MRRPTATQQQLEMATTPSGEQVGPSWQEPAYVKEPAYVSMQEPAYAQEPAYVPRPEPVYVQRREAEQVQSRQARGRQPEHLVPPPTMRAAKSYTTAAPQPDTMVTALLAAMITIQLVMLIVLVIIARRL